MSSRKLRIALLCYAVLAVAGFGISHRDMRLVLWIFLAGLGVKSWIAWKKSELDKR